MTITFESENDVIVYALEKIICYARNNHYIFVAQSVWWIASVIGLSEGQATHIDNLRIRVEASRLIAEEDQLSLGKDLPVTIPECLNIGTQDSHIHPDRIPQVDTDNRGPEAEDNQAKLDQADTVIQSAKRFLIQSQRERKALKQKPCGLSRTRSGKIPVKPLTKKQSNRLWAIPIDTISAYLESRKKN